MADATTAYPGWLFRSETVQEVVPVGGKQNYCDYRMWRTFEGFASYYILMTPTYTDIVEALRDLTHELKDNVESNAQKVRRSKTY